MEYEALAATDDVMVGVEVHDRAGNLVFGADNYLLHSAST